MLHVVLAYVVLDLRTLVINKRGHIYTFLEFIFQWERILIKKHRVSSTAKGREENSPRTQGHDHGFSREASGRGNVICDLNNQKNEVRGVPEGEDARRSKRKSLAVGPAWCAAGAGRRRGPAASLRPAARPACGGEGQSVGRASHRGGEVGTPSEDVWEPLEGFKQGRELRVSLDVLKGDLDGCVESKQRGISEVESGKPASIVT